MSLLAREEGMKLWRRMASWVLVGSLICQSLFVQDVHATDTDRKEEEKQVLVVYKNGKGKEAAQERGEVLYTFKTIPALSVEAKERDVNALKRNPNVLRVEENASFSITENKTSVVLKTANVGSTEETTWNVKMLHAPEAWERGITGKSVKVAVVDTGVTPHSDLQVKGGVSTVDYTSSYMDDNGHGTHVAGIISAERNGVGMVGVAPDADIYAVKAMNAEGKGTLLDILEALDWCIQNRMDIVNISLATSVDSPTLKTMVQEMANKGMLLVASSGNVGTMEETQDSVLYPARWDEVIAVGAVDEQMKRTWFSSAGPSLDVVAPGENIVSTAKDGISYVAKTGTSQAAPHVSGMLALLKQEYPTFTASQLRQELVKQAQDLGATGRDDWYGYGLVQWLKQVQIPEGVLQQIDLTLKLAERYKLSTYINRAKQMIEALPESEEKQAFMQRLQKLLSQQVEVQPLPVREPSQMELRNAELTLQLAERYKLPVYIDRAKRFIDALPDGVKKQELLQRWEMIQR
ncbi:UNVERIFIED_ORG: minor extracellular protease Epr [Anoxybacillus amylolyticus]